MIQHTMPLHHNSRFYILCVSLVLSIGVASLARLTIASDQLYLIRLEQLYGVIALIYWYGAMGLSPLSSVIGKARLRHLLFARRAIGVSAAYFAVLHGSVALFGQLGGLGGLGSLEGRFLAALYVGFFALIILLVMAATSFDRVVQYMTFPRWKLLHRLVYAAGIAILFHVWLIGTHAAYLWVQLLALALLSILFALEGLRIAKVLARKYPSLDQRDIKITIALTIWLSLTILVASIPGIFTSYHGAHALFVVMGGLA